VPFVRTLINPMCGVVGIDKKSFFFYNALGAIIWTESIIALGFILGEKLEGSIDAYLLPVIGVIIFASLVPVFIEIFREWQTRKHHK
jgi:membrane-associated protein